MKSVTVGDKEYTFLINYQMENKYRAAFNDLAEKIFGISFEDWYQAGYWNEKYILYTLFIGERAVANVSVNIMDFNTFGKNQRYVQIGTVMTDEEYRHKNLCRFLMEQVLEEWHGKCEFIYLYANNSVLEMYPKFGFNKVKEYEYFKCIQSNAAKHGNLIKLNMDIQSNRDKLYDYAKNSNVFGKFSMRENADLVMFYCISFLKDNVYYIKPLDIIVIATFNNNQLRLFDIFGKVEVEINSVFDYLVSFQVDNIVLGFTPNDCSSYDVRQILGDDTLFIQNGKTQLFEDNKVMFPLLSHA